MTRSGSLVAGNSVDSKTFSGLAFPTVPARVLVTVRGPADGDIIYAQVRDGSITTDGFTVDFSADVPGSGSYYIDYIAIL